MLTSVGQLTDKDLGGPPKGLVTHLKIEGIDVVALNVPYHQTMGPVRRIRAFVSFMLLSCWQVLRTKSVDIIYASSTPLTVGVPALVGRWFRRIPYVFEVRDIWPAALVALGLIRSRVSIWFLQHFERAVYRRAAAILALSPGMEVIVRRNAPRRKQIVTVPNCSDTDLFHPGMDGKTIRRERGWMDKFVCLHSGAMGRINGLDVIVRAAEYFRDEPDFLFVLMGEGKEKAGLVEARDRLGLQNLQISDSVPKNRLPAVVAAADLCLMTVANASILQHNSANKFFDYLAAGKPVLLNYGGWQREVLESASAGLGCEQGDDEAFFANLAALKADADRRAAMGRNARDLALREFDRDKLAAQALEVITQACDSDRTAQPKAPSQGRATRSRNRIATSAKHRRTSSRASTGR